MEQVIDKYIKGTQYVNIRSAVTAEELTSAKSASENYLSQECIKFIPASGSATRMFKDLYRYLEDQEETAFIVDFFGQLEQFAFYSDIKGRIESEAIDEQTIAGKMAIIQLVLQDELNYSNLPKALIKMHAYGDAASTPIDEHIYEGEQYLNRESIKLHFTISKEHERLFTDYVHKALEGKEHVDISYSFQKKITDTMAVDMNNEPFVDDEGEVLYRAGGHGSLIENLNDLDADIIFIKNIDNVCHRDHVKDTIDSKKMLASLGFDVKGQIDHYIKAILADDCDMTEIRAFIQETLKITYRNEMTEEAALSLLNRPLRVCGMVKNQGEPGGGPFIVDNGGYLDLQICEKSEIDTNNHEKLTILNQSQFFNPVDLICFVKDYKNEKFDLLQFTNPERYFITEKSYKGRPLKALEHPGLWNGAMHNWNTLFVEVPLSTFNPAKNINDLLRKGHRASK